MFEPGALAEGEELGSNILHLGDTDPRSPDCHGGRTSGQHARLICRMSALHPIATELLHCSEMTRRAICRHQTLVKPKTLGKNQATSGPQNPAEHFVIERSDRCRR